MARTRRPTKPRPAAAIRLAAPAPPPPDEPANLLTQQVAIADTRSGVRFGIGTRRRYNPDDLAGRKGLRIYDEMMRDEQVKACLGLKVAAIIGPGWTVEPGDETDAARALAEQVQDDLTGLPGPFEDVLEGVLSALAYGFSLTEQVYTLEGGRMKLAKLQPIAPHDINFDQDQYGVIEGIRQLGWGPFPTGEPMPVGKFIHYAHQAFANFANPFGRSDLYAAYRSYFHKFHWVQWLAVFGEKLADAPVVYKYPKNSTDTKIQQSIRVLENLQARTVFAMPNEDGTEVSLLETQRQPRNMFLDTLDHYDRAISRALLIPEKLGVTGGQMQAGSYALAQTQERVFVMTIELHQRRLEACLNEQLVKRMAMLIDPATVAPKLKLQPITQDDRMAIVDAWTKATAAGLPVTARDLIHVKQLLDFPEMDEADMQAELDAKRAMAPTPSPAGNDGQQQSDTQAGKNGGDAITAAPNRADMIVQKHGDEWWVLSEDGSQVLGKHDNAQDAYRQLAAIEHAKARRGDMAADEDVAPMVAALLAIPVESVPVTLRAQHEALLVAFGGGSDA